MVKTTLFVTDLPANLPEADFQALFASEPGFMAARLRPDKNTNIVGFVEFSDKDTATVIKDKFQGYKFNPSDHGLSFRFSHGMSSKRTREREGESDMFVEQNRGMGVMLPPTDGMPPYYNPFSAIPNYPGAPAEYSAEAYAFSQAHAQQQHHPHMGMGMGMGMGGYPPPAMYPPEASTTLYVEGLPLDSTEREVAHIFRPFPGYQSLRIIRKESKQTPSRVYTLCFIEFDSKYQASVALNALNGYRMDKVDQRGLKITFAKTERLKKGGPRDKSRDSNNNTNNAMDSTAAQASANGSGGSDVGASVVDYEAEGGGGGDQNNLNSSSSVVDPNNNNAYAVDDSSFSSHNTSITEASGAPAGYGF